MTQDSPSGTLDEVIEEEEAPAILEGISEEQEKQNTSNIANEIHQIKQRISELKAEISQYTGGLILAVLQSTLSIEQQSLAMLKQKQASWLYGIDLDYTIDQKPFVLPSNAGQLISQLEQDIIDLEQGIINSRSEAELYSGGLILATLLSTNATQQKTLAMLKQKRLALSYGLPQFVGFVQAAPSTAKQAPASVTNPKEKPKEKQWDIVSIDSKVTETNSVWWKYAWILKIKNTGDTALRFSAQIEFLDEDGFVIDDNSESNLIVAAGETATFTGYELVRLPGAHKVNSTSVKVRVN